MKVETCSNCERVIGKLEQAHVFHGNVVCQNCYQKLTDTEGKQVQAEVKKPIEVKAKTVPPQTKSKKQTSAFTWVVFWSIILGGVVLLYVKPVTTQKTPQQQYVGIGERGYLSKDTAVATSKAAYNAWLTARITNDNYGVGELLFSGQLFLVDDETPVLHLTGSSIGLREVRILGGKHIGKSGWVAVEHLKK
jgi:hypothetical protein